MLNNIDLKIIGMHEDACDQCRKLGKGVRFYLHVNPDTESFLCWEHFRLQMETFMELGLIERHPRVEKLIRREEVVHRTVEERPSYRRGESWSGSKWGESEGRTTTRPRSVGIGRNETDGVSHSQARSISVIRSQGTSNN